MNPAELTEILAIGRRLQTEVLEPMKSTFVGKDEIIDLLGVCLAGGENLFLLGPPGTAKSAIVHDLGLRLHGQTFEYLLTRFTEPNELFGPFDIRKLREGVLETNTEGMLPEASLVFLDELLNANSAILNSLLTALNERVLRRGRQVFRLPMLMAVGASNHLPQEEALQALLDRFLLRARSDNVPEADLPKVLAAGWRLEGGHQETAKRIGVDEARRLQGALHAVDLTPISQAYLAVVSRMRSAGLALSDRRAVKLQRLVAASALLCGRSQAVGADLWALRHVWDIEEQREILRALVDEVIAETKREPGKEHPRALEQEPPDAESLAEDLERLGREYDDGDLGQKARLRDRLSLIASRAEWVENERQREALRERVDALWRSLEPTNP